MPEETIGVRCSSLWGHNCAVALCNSQRRETLSRLSFHHRQKSQGDPRRTRLGGKRPSADCINLWPTSPDYHTFKAETSFQILPCPPLFFMRSIRCTALYLKKTYAHLFQDWMFFFSSCDRLAKSHIFWNREMTEASLRLEHLLFE